VMNIDNIAFGKNINSEKLNNRPRTERKPTC
jgi:hypothetical protein